METTDRPAGQTVILHGGSWETYESLLADHIDHSAPRFAYDWGVLEIMSPSPEHEKLARRIARLVLAISEESRLEAEDFGSTTFRRKELERGSEPDSCFCIQNEARVRDKDRIDLATDPPPDLVIDIASPSMRKIPIYAQLGVPKVWRYDGNKAAILRLETTGYVEAAESLALPLTSTVLSGFVEKGKSMRRTAWLREIRARARGQA